MKMERIYSNAVSEPAPGLWSNCKRLGNQVFLSGLVALDIDGNVQGVDDPKEGLVGSQWREVASVRKSASHC